MQTAKNSSQEPAARTVGIRELKSKASEIIRQVRETGRPIDITVRGQVVARLNPTAGESAPFQAGANEERTRAVQEWLEKMDSVSSRIAEVWPEGVSSQDVINDVRGSW